jgi:hypothetical protein
MPIPIMNTKKPRKPMTVMPSITLDAGERRPSQPAIAAAASASQPSQRGTAPVVKIATPYSGSATAQPSAFPV